MTAVKRRSASSPPSAKTTRKKQLDLAALAETFRKFRTLKTTEAEAKKQHEELRDEELVPALVEFGEAHGDRGQHLAIELPEEIDGFVRLVRRANQTTLLDLDAAEALMTDKGILTDVQTGAIAITGIPADVMDELVEAITVLLKDTEVVDATLASRVAFDQDKMMAYHQAHRDEDAAKQTAKARGKRKPGPLLTETEVDKLFVTETSYSFWPEKR